MEDEVPTKQHGRTNTDMTNTSSTSKPDPAQQKPSTGLFSRFTFLRSSDDGDDTQAADEVGTPPKSKKSIDDEGAEGRLSFTSPDEAVDLERSNTIKPRKRKGSLRKSALLGVKRLGSDSKERRSSLLQRSPVKETKASEDNSVADEETTPSAKQSRAPFVIGSASSSSSSLGSGPPGVPLSAALARQAAEREVTESLPPVPKSPVVYASTTEDDDDAIALGKSPKLVTSTTAFTTASNVSPASTSYFPPQTGRPSSRPAHHIRPSPLQNAYAPAPEPYSYTETEYWGWVILFITWLLFTVGMGSCLDIWSWAWDVGETPYAPPELEDDPTLPIVGYYPALIVLTGVVAWVWITVAWVGLKYFRHAKIEV